MLTQIEKECLLACQACAAACWQCASACLKEDDPKAMVRCIELDMGCADLCQLTAASIARGDEHAQALCTLCAQVCKACAAQCSASSTPWHIAKTAPKRVSAVRLPATAWGASAAANAARAHSRLHSHGLGH